MSRTSWAFFLVFLLSLLVFTNLNGILESLTGVGELGSPLILFTSLGIIYLTPFKWSDVSMGYKIFTLFIISYLLIGWISGLWHMDEGHFEIGSAKVGSRQLITSFILVTTFYMTIVNACKLEVLDDYLNFLFYIFIITLLAGIFEDYLGLRKVLYQGYKNTRNLGFFGNPNQTGMQANLTFVFAVWMYFRKNISVLIFLLVMGLCTYGALLSFSRMAIIMNTILIISFITYLIIAGFSRRGFKFNIKNWILLSSISVSTVILVQFVAIPFYNELDSGQKNRIDTIGKLILKREVNNKTTALRSGIFTEAVVYINQRPFEGYGLHTFSKGGMFKTSISHGVHNMYLKIFGEAGMIVFLLYCILVLNLVFGIIFNYSYVGYILSLFGITVALYSISSHGVLSQKFIISLLGVFLALDYCYKKNRINFLIES